MRAVPRRVFATSVTAKAVQVKSDGLAGARQRRVGSHFGDMLSMCGNRPSKVLNQYRGGTVFLDAISLAPPV